MKPSFASEAAALRSQSDPDTCLASLVLNLGVDPAAITPGDGVIVWCRSGRWPVIMHGRHSDHRSVAYMIESGETLDL